MLSYILNKSKKIRTLSPIDVRNANRNHYKNENPNTHRAYYIHMYICNSYKYIRENYRFFIV